MTCAAPPLADCWALSVTNFVKIFPSQATKESPEETPVLNMQHVITQQKYNRPEEERESKEASHSFRSKLAADQFSDKRTYVFGDATL